MTDEQNPKLIFNLTDTELLIKIANGEIDAKELAKPVCHRLFKL